MNYETLNYKVHENIGVLSLNRPEALNALNQQLLNELSDLLKDISRDSLLRCLIITGEGKAFVAGADIKEMENHSQDQALEMSKKGQTLFNCIEDLKIPVIAAVNGFALGGGLELALACDFIVASHKAKMGLPEVSLGLIPGYGGTQRLSRYVGKNIARLMTLTGEIYSAQQCYDWGLVTKLSEPDGLMQDCMAIAKTLASRSPFALSLAKQAINKGYDHEQNSGLSLEAELFAKTFTSEDHNEGIKAFIEKRAPKFTGK